MFGKIYALPISTMIFLAVMGTVLWILTGLIRPRRWIRGIQICILIMVTGFVIHSTLAGRTLYSERRLSLVPFASFEAAKIQPEVYRSLLLNCLMFLAFGLSLGWVLPEKWRNWKRALTVILTGLIFSLTIEILQYFLRLGIGETDDVIFNTLGCVLAAGAMLLRDRLVRYRKKRAEHSALEDRTEKPQ